MKTTMLAAAAMLTAALPLPSATRAACDDAELRQKARAFAELQKTVQRNDPARHAQAMRALLPELKRLRDEQDKNAADAEAACAFFDRATKALQR